MHVPKITPQQTIEFAEHCQQRLVADVARMRFDGRAQYELDYLAVAARFYGMDSGPVDRFLRHYYNTRLPHFTNLDAERVAYAKRDQDRRSLADEALDVVTATLRAAQVASQAVELPAGQPVDGGATESDPANVAMNVEAKALALLAQHPDWSEGKIAKAADCSRQHLYKLPKYRKARTVMRQSKSEFPRGTKYGQRIEATDED